MDMQLELDEVRRLTGPNLLSDDPGAIIDVMFKGPHHSEVKNCLTHYVQSILHRLNWQDDCFTRDFEGGLSLSIVAEMDCLYSACEVLEIAWECCEAELTGNEIPEIDINAIKQSITEEKHPQLLSLIEAAEVNNVLCLSDDDEVSLGAGSTCKTWDIADCPNAEDVNWSDYSSIPIGMITGTNGKSTSVRLAAKIAQSEGLNAGVTSTDFIKVGNDIIDEGDYSGPGGARMLLRDNRTEIAFLEIARGGLLRRGLPIHHANAALVTNAAADHLGQYGINTVDDIAQVKLLLAKALSENCTLVLNADDERLVKYVQSYAVPTCWFSVSKDNQLVEKHRESNKPCVYLQDDSIVYEFGEKHIFKNVKDMPMTINGTAMHNVQNALGVVGLCKSLGISDEAISKGLSLFGSRPEDNPGRANIYNIDGVKVIVDFAHNPHSMQAVVNMTANIPANNKFVLFSHAGDRSDKDITDVTEIVAQMKPDTYILAELEEYLRGREPGEISDIVEGKLNELGVNSTNISKVSDPFSGTKFAMENAKVGDLVLLFILDQRKQVQDYISSL